MTARQARETNPEGATQSVGPPPQPGAFRRILHPLINRWPLTITAAPVFQAEHIDHGLGFARFTPAHAGVNRRFRSETTSHTEQPRPARG